MVENLKLCFVIFCIEIERAVNSGAEGWFEVWWFVSLFKRSGGINNLNAALFEKLSQSLKLINGFSFFLF